MEFIIETTISKVIKSILKNYKSSKSEKNNVIIIIGDDMGIELLKMYQDQMQGQGRTLEEYPNTPVLDELVSQGIRLNRAYAYPSCSPTRSTMLTGRYGFRTGVRIPTSKNCPKFGLYFPQPTIPLSIPQSAKKAIFGKWHLNPYEYDGPNVQHVLESGFEVYDGLIEGNISDQPSYINWLRQSTDDFDGFYEERYFTSVITDSAIEWLHENQVTN